MNTEHEEPAAAADGGKTGTRTRGGTLSRREFVAVAAAVGATTVLPGALSAAPDGKKTFTILHTNDMHSAFIGLARLWITRRLRSTMTRPRADIRAWRA